MLDVDRLKELLAKYGVEPSKGGFEDFFPNWEGPTMSESALMGELESIGRVYKLAGDGVRKARTARARREADSAIKAIRRATAVLTRQNPDLRPTLDLLRVVDPSLPAFEAVTHDLNRIRIAITQVASNPDAALKRWCRERGVNDPTALKEPSPVAAAARSIRITLARWTTVNTNEYGLPSPGGSAWRPRPIVHLAAELLAEIGIEITVEAIGQVWRRRDEAEPWDYRHDPEDDLDFDPDP